MVGAAQADRRMARLEDEPWVCADRGVVICHRRSGFILNLSIATLDESIRRTFEPDPANRGLYDGLYHEFVSIFRQMKGTFHRLNP